MVNTDHDKGRSKNSFKTIELCLLDLPQTRVDLNYNKIGGQITNVMTKSLPNDKLLLIMLLIGHYDSIHDTLLNSRFKKKKLDFLLVFCPSLGGGQCGLATLTQLFSEAR